MSNLVGNLEDIFCRDEAHIGTKWPKSSEMPLKDAVGIVDSADPDVGLNVFSLFR